MNPFFPFLPLAKTISYEFKLPTVENKHPSGVNTSLRASSPIWAIETSHAAPRGFAARSRVLAWLVSIAQIGELARRLGQHAMSTMN